MSGTMTNIFLRMLRVLIRNKSSDLLGDYQTNLTVFLKPQTNRNSSNAAYGY